MADLLKYFKKADIFFTKLAETLKSLVAVIIFSSFTAALRFKKISKYQKNKVCFVLGNGPSLSNELTEKMEHFKQGDVLAVNYFANTKFFSIIKPKYYIFIDPVVFDSNGKLAEKNNELINNFNSIKWEILIFIPYSKRKAKIISQFKNPLIRIVFFNGTTATGFRSFRNFIYKNNLGIPSSRNVSIPAILQMINFNYREIYIYGMDHSWLKTLFVDENNIIHEDDRHFFDKDKVNIRSKAVQMNRLMLGYSIVFNSHMLLQDYAIKRDTRIVNCSRGSFIDAYEKMKYK